MLSKHVCMCRPSPLHLLTSIGRPREAHAGGTSGYPDPPPWKASSSGVVVFDSIFQQAVHQPTMQTPHERRGCSSCCRGPDDSRRVITRWKADFELCQLRQHVDGTRGMFWGAKRLGYGSFSDSLTLVGRETHLRKHCQELRRLR